MKNFRSFHENKDLELFLEAVDIENFQPLDGQWTHGSWGSSYIFNVEGDDCEDCTDYKNRNSGRCYALSFAPHSDNVSISFTRCSTTSDSSKNVHWAFAKTVLKAVIEYVDLKNPKSFSWLPVGKSKANKVTNRVENRDARRKLYSKFFERYLFPDKYVPVTSTSWVSRKEYDSNYVPVGYPAIPESLNKESSASEKSKAVEEIHKKIGENRTNIARAENERREQEIRRQREEEERRIREEEERLRRAIDDTEINPNLIKEKDIAVVTRNPNSYSGNHVDRLGKVERIYFRNVFETNPETREQSSVEKLYARIRFSEFDDNEEFNGASMEIPIAFLAKENEEAKRQREIRSRETLNLLMSNPENNPNNVREGDEVISFISPTSTQNGLVGTIRRITHSRSHYNTTPTLKAEIDWNEESTQKIRQLGYNASSPVFIKNLFKNNEENRREIQRRTRTHEVQSQASRNRERIERRRQRDDYVASRMSNQTPEEIQHLVDHPNNPEHLKINDFVKINPRGWYNRRYRDKKGTVVHLRKDPYDDNQVKLGVAIHRTHRVVEFYASELQRDTSENAARIQTRQRRRQEVSQLSRGFNIGDNIKVNRGRYNGKIGTILNFRLVNGILSAIIASEDRNFSVKIDFIERLQNPHGLPEMNLTFKDYMTILESF